jgi:hypothetical protein
MSYKDTAWPALSDQDFPELFIISRHVAMLAKESFLQTPIANIF